MDDAAWRKRLNAASSAQAKYLWTLLVLGLFYWFIQPRAGASLTMPVVGAPLPASVVLASAPAVLLLVILVIGGTLRAYRTAEVKIGRPPADETIDEHPNAIDWATYTTERSPRWLQLLLGFTYPLYLSLFAFEAWYFLVGLTLDAADIPGRWLFIAVASVEAPAVFFLLFIFWRGRLRRPRSTRAGAGGTG